jgi:hypothetical protein
VYDVLRLLADRMEGQAVDSDARAAEVVRLDRQLDDVQAEETLLKEQIVRAKAESQAAREVKAGLQTAEALLRQLNQKMDQPLTWEKKRQVVEALVPAIHVHTQTEGSSAWPVWSSPTPLVAPLQELARVHRRHHGAAGRGGE